MQALQLADKIPIGIFMINADYKVVFWNACFADWTGMSLISVSGKDVRDIFPRFRSPKYEARLEKLFTDGLPIILSYQLNGDIFSSNSKIHQHRVHHCTITLAGGDSGPLALFAIEDRTEISRRIKDARAALAEKTMLMKELNHRVKNNLNMMRSLINLQIEDFPDQYSKTIFRDLDMRISSISLLHEMLYKANVVEGVSLKSYLESLCDNIYSTFLPDGTAIKMSLEMDEATVSSDTTLHVGLIVSELLTNAIKYGIKDRDSGLIELSLRRVSEELVLSISDDGPGLPEGFDPLALKSLGMKLVYLIADQLGGSMEYDAAPGAAPGTRFTLRIPAENAGQ